MENLFSSSNHARIGEVQVACVKNRIKFHDPQIKLFPDDKKNNKLFANFLTNSGYSQTTQPEDSRGNEKKHTQFASIKNSL